MRNLMCVGAALITGLAFWGIACSASNDEAAGDQAMFPPTGTDAGAGAYGGSGGWTGTGGMPGSGGGAYSDGGAYAGAAGGQPPPARDAGSPEDAGVDAAEPTCDDLDSSQPAVLFLSADDSNSMASPVIARRVIQSQTGVVPSLVLRTYEFLNYYNVPYEVAAPGELRVVAQMRPGAADTDMELQIGVQSQAPVSPRRPMTITLVLDTSGSMGGSPMERERAAVRAVAGSLQTGDIVSAVTWNVSNAVLLDGHVAVGPNDPTIMSLAQGLSAGGGTDLHGGLTAGYALAEQNYGPDRINRVVLISDGQANVGVTDETLIGEKAEDEHREGIYLVGVGTGDGYNDTLMNAVTDAGNGAYVFLDTEDEAQMVFGTRFDEVMEVAAKAVRVRATLPWYFSMYKFHGEEYSTNPREVKPQHLAPGDAQVFHQVLRACDATMINNDDPMEFAAFWTQPLTYEQKSVVVSASIGDLLAGADEQLKRGRAIVAYAEMLKLSATMTPSERSTLIGTTLTLVNAANPGGTDPAMNEITELLVTYDNTVGQ